MTFAEELRVLKDRLEEHGHDVLMPDIEFASQESDTPVDDSFDRQESTDALPPEHEVWRKKGNAMTTHFRKIDAGDAILVANYEKKGVPNYIGSNAFLEMGYAYGTGKPIYILNELPEDSSFTEEILGMQPVVLGGDIERIE